MRDRKSKGFSLLELLIAVVLLSIGMLGAAALQISGLRNVHNAYLHSQAGILAEDIGERMRANRAGVRAGSYHLAHLAHDHPSAGGYPSCYAPAGCSAHQLAHHDIRVWQQAVSNLLPAGAGLVCIDSTPDDGSGALAAAHQCDGIGEVYAAKIWWRENDNHNSALKRYSLRMRP